MTLDFVKMNGAGNDFVMLDNRDLSLSLSKEDIALLCDRHRGVGADGLLAVEPAQNGADFRMRYYNADGGEAEMCGNGARCFARFAQKLTGGDKPIRFETPAGVIGAEYFGDQVRVQLSEPFDLSLGEDIEILGSQRTIHNLNTGVPHAVVVVPDLEKVDIRPEGSAIRYHERYAPAGTNVNFMQVEDDSSIAIRTYERGVEDETLACGTGMVANAIIHHLLTGVESPIRVRVRGGDVLEVAFEGDVDSGFRNVTLTGPADFVFEGVVDLPD
ncbi:MAG: diaminopimelate epimerase [Verrucomicrobiota bacterium]